jgi:hypothetical protein
MKKKTRKYVKTEAWYKSRSKKLEKKLGIKPRGEETPFNLISNTEELKFPMYNVSVDPYNPYKQPKHELCKWVLTLRDQNSQLADLARSSRLASVKMDKLIEQLIDNPFIAIGLWFDKHILGRNG